MKLLVDLIVAVLQRLLPWLVRESRSTAEDGNPDRETRKRLRDKVKKHWVILILLLLTGCVRTIYVPHGTPVRLRKTIEDAKVWVKDADGRVVAGEMDLPEGWYCLPVDTEEDK